MIGTAAQQRYTEEVIHSAIAPYKNHQKLQFMHVSYSKKELGGKLEGKVEGRFRLTESHPCTMRQQKQWNLNVSGK